MGADAPCGRDAGASSARRTSTRCSRSTIRGLGSRTSRGSPRRSSADSRAVERKARWVLDTIGATDLGFGDDVPYDERAWEQVAQGASAEGRRPGRGVLPPGARRGAGRPAGRPRPVSCLRLVPRPARPSARAPAPLARDRASAVGRRPLCRCAEPRRRHTVALDAPGRPGRRAAAEGRSASADARRRRGARRVRSRASRSTGSAAPTRTGASSASSSSSAPAALRPSSSSSPGSASRRTARRRTLTPGCSHASSRRCSGSGRRSVSTRATRLPSTPS